ncbi:MAG TPA: serine/threonine-protein kinase, partial [Thermomicrobiales bacterium]|nr:serine/threonine-protein kinase [Thermomicrobiales bacterium]
MAEAAAGALDGRYRLERELGRGGFARVYLATDLRLGRAVAVKALDAQLAAQAPERDFAVRFDREAHAVAALHHPHILPVYDYGAAGGALYLVMPYVAGGSLADLLRREGPLSPARASHYLAQIAGALDYAHRRGVVHRDLKPANLLLDEGDRLLLADFGIAKLLGEAGATTGQTGVVGTPSYMPPEQFQGRVGPPTDIYALGCLLYELLTGAPPYGGTTEQVIYGHLYGAIPSLAERTGGRAPAALQPVLERAMAKWPEERYPTAGDLAGAVAAALAAPAPAPAPPAAGWAPTAPAPPG